MYRSEDPYDFGLDNDDYPIGKLDVAAAEIVGGGEKECVSSSKDVWGGVRLQPEVGRIKTLS